MGAVGDELTLSLTYVADGVSAEELDRRMLALRRDFSELGLTAQRPTAPSPDCAKGLGEVADTLLVTAAGSPELLISMVSAARSWLARQRHNTGAIYAKIGDTELKLDTPTNAQQDAVVKAFVDHVKRSSLR